MRLRARRRSNRFGFQQHETHNTVNKTGSGRVRWHSNKNWSLSQGESFSELLFEGS